MKRRKRIWNRRNSIRSKGLVLGQFSLDLKEPPFECIPQLDGRRIENIAKVMLEADCKSEHVFIAVFYHDEDDLYAGLKRRIFTTDMGKLDLKITGEVFRDGAACDLHFPEPAEIDTMQGTLAFQMNQLARAMEEFAKGAMTAVWEAAKSMADAFASFNASLEQIWDIRGLREAKRQRRRKALDPEGQRREGFKWRRMALHRQARRTP